MKTMPAGEFKAQCLRVMEDVKKYRTAVVITKKGRPVAKLIPPRRPGDRRVRLHGRDGEDRR